MCRTWTSDRRVQADMVSFRIAHAGKRTVTSWNRRAGYDHPPACLLDPAEHRIQPSVAKQ